MAGGVGERFWPISRQENPKQFLQIADDKTLLEATFERAKKIVSPERIFVFTTQPFVEQIQLLLPIPKENVVGEPYSRNTAPSLGLCVLKLIEKLGEDTVAVLPCDHMIQDENKFLQEMFNSFDFLTKNKAIVTFGIVPNYPEIEYGYIEKDSSSPLESSYPIFKVKKFIEKPRLDKAQEFVLSGNYLWNSGILIFNTTFFMEQYKKYLPNIYDGLANTIMKTSDEEIIKKTYERFPKISLAYGLLENMNDIFVMEVNFSWYILSTWLSLENIHDTDRNGNVIIKGEFLGVDTKDSMIYTDDGLIATIGVNNLIIAKSGNAILICNKEQSREIKNLVKKLDTYGQNKYK
jgi:mannose-1-phosphate guanylyltransferase